MSRKFGRKGRDETWTRLLGGAATCFEGFVIHFLRVPPACMGCMAATVKPNGLGNSQKIVNKPSEQVAAPPGI